MGLFLLRHMGKLGIVHEVEGLSLESEDILLWCHFISTWTPQV